MSYPQWQSVRRQAVHCLRWNQSRGWDAVGCRPVVLSQESGYYSPYHPDHPLPSQSYNTRKQLFSVNEMNDIVIFKMRHPLYCILTITTWLLSDCTCHNPLCVHPRPGPSPERTEPDWVNRFRGQSLFCTHSPELVKECRRSRRYYNYIILQSHCSSFSVVHLQ